MSGDNNSAGTYSIVLYKNRNNGKKIPGDNNVKFYRTYATTEAREYWIEQMKESGARPVKIWGGLSERAYLKALSVLNRSPLCRESLELIVQNVTKEVRNAKVRKRKL
jgi:hypothetical protein